MDILLNTLMVMVSLWRGSVEAVFIIGAAKMLEAVVATCSLPFIDGSDSQRNVENWATAASLWLMGVGMMLLALEIHLYDEPNEGMQWAWTGFSLASMLVVPAACWIDVKFPPEAMVGAEDKDDQQEGVQQEQEQQEQPALRATSSSGTCQGVINTSNELNNAQSLSKAQAQARLAELEVKMHDELTDVMFSPDLECKNQLEHSAPAVSMESEEAPRLSVQQAQQMLEQLRAQRDSGEVSEIEYRAKKYALRQQVAKAKTKPEGASAVDDHLIAATVGGGSSRPRLEGSLG